MTVEVLEGRELLSTVATTVVPQIQPTGTASVAVQRAAQAQQSKARNANAGDALRVGGQFTKTVLSSTTGTVISNYTKALLRGDGKELKNLGSSSAVKQLGTSFTNVANSSQAKAIGHSFKSFGNSVSNEFQKIFG